MNKTEHYANVQQRREEINKYLSDREFNYALQSAKYVPGRKKWVAVLLCLISFGANFDLLYLRQYILFIISLAIYLFAQNTVPESSIVHFLWAPASIAQIGWYLIHLLMLCFNIWPYGDHQFI